MTRELFPPREFIQLVEGRRMVLGENWREALKREANRERVALERERSYPDNYPRSSGLIGRGFHKERVKHRAR